MYAYTDLTEYEKGFLLASYAGCFYGEITPEFQRGFEEAKRVKTETTKETEDVN